MLLDEIKYSKALFVFLATNLFQDVDCVTVPTS